MLGSDVQVVVDHDPTRWLRGPDVDSPPETCRAWAEEALEAYVDALELRGAEHAQVHRTLLEPSEDHDLVGEAGVEDVPGAPGWQRLLCSARADTPLQVLRGGGGGTVAAMSDEIAQLSVQFPGLVSSTDANATRVATAAGTTGFVFDLPDKILGGSTDQWNDALGIDDAHVPDFLEDGKPGVGAYDDLEGGWTHGPGGHLG